MKAGKACILMKAMLTNVFSEPVPAIRAYVERLRCVNNVPRMRVARCESSVADVCLKRHSFLHFSLDQSRGLTHSKATMPVNESLLGTLGDETKGHVNS